MNRDSRIFVAGHCGMVGSACVRRLIAEGYRNLLLRTHAELELTDRRAVDAFFETGTQMARWLAGQVAQILRPLLCSGYPSRYR